MQATLVIQENVSLKRYTTFGIGGPARYFAEVHSKEDVEIALRFAYQHSLPFRVLGKGSNALFHDQGYAGLVMLNKMQQISWRESCVHVGSGYSFALLGVQAAKKGLSGLEFAAGIPGSVGGAVFMNAGASQQEISEVIQEVGFVDISGNYHVYPKEKITFSYRHSSFHEIKGCIVSATMILQPAQQVRKRQLEIIAYRTKTQPYGSKSAGCVFRNPPGKSAGALIESAGLKGVKLGGASVSTMHCNFIVNEAEATAEEVMQLAAFVREKVFEHAGVMLEMEVVVIPYDEGVSYGRV